jgi:hypothetical protein
VPRDEELQLHRARTVGRGPLLGPADELPPGPDSAELRRDGEHAELGALVVDSAQPQAADRSVRTPRHHQLAGMQVLGDLALGAAWRVRHPQSLLRLGVDGVDQAGELRHQLRSTAGFDPNLAVVNDQG